MGFLPVMFVLLKTFQHRSGIFVSSNAEIQDGRQILSLELTHAHWRNASSNFPRKRVTLLPLSSTVFYNVEKTVQCCPPWFDGFEIIERYFAVMYFP